MSSGLVSQGETMAQNLAGRAKLTVATLQLHDLGWHPNGVCALRRGPKDLRRQAEIIVQAGESTQFDPFAEPALISPPLCQIETELINVSSHTLPSTSKPRGSPLYGLKLSYRRTTNASKSLIRKSAQAASLAYGDLVDEEGGIEEERVKDWVGKLVGGVVGDESGKGRTASGSWPGSGSNSPTMGVHKSLGTKEE